MNKFNNFKVRTKILMLPVLFVIGTIILQVGNYAMSKKLSSEVIFPNFKEQVLNASKLTIQSVVEVQAMVLGDLIKDISNEQDRIVAIEKATDPLRFFDDKSGYLFVSDLAGLCINNPANKGRNGKNFADEKDADGVLLNTEMAKAAQSGGGFVTYRFEKQGKGIQPKVSYATMIPGTDYFVGAGVYIDNVEAEKAALEENITKEQHRYQVYNSLVFLAVFVPVLLLAIFIAGAIARPVIATTDMIKDIAQGEGDLTRRLEVNSQDEIGQLAMWFNTFVDKVHGIIREVAATAQEVSSAATQVAASSEEMSAGINQQVEQATQVSAAVEEMTSTVVEVARKAADASAHSDNAGKRAQDGLGVVEKTIAGMNNIAQVVGESSVSIDELGKRGVQIGEIIGVINDIADQTNLLALNAAIEAARAGEHGRGFAVVADEVRKLADRTTSATDEVAQAIKAIQSETHTAVEKMGMGTKRVEEGVELARESGDSLTSIVDGTSQVAMMIQSIAAAAEEQSATSEQIARNIDNITAITRQSAEGAEQASSAAAQLSSKSEMLQRIVGQFKI